MMGGGARGNVDVAAFVMYCDENRLTLMAGVALAEEIGAELQSAAEDRRDVLAQIAPELIDDGYESPGGDDG